MSESDTVAQLEATTTYRLAERRMRRRASMELHAGREHQARYLLGLATHIGVAMVRELRRDAPEPDEWEWGPAFTADGNEPRDGLWG